MGALTRSLYILLLLLLLPALAAAQGTPVVIIDPITSDAARVIAGELQTTGGGGGGGTVTQGPNNGSVLTSAAWSTRLIFGDAVIDPRLVTVQNWLTTAIAPSSTRLSDGAAFYDARVIRALTFATDAVDVSGSTVATTPPSSTTSTGTLDADAETVDISTPEIGTVSLTLTGTLDDMTGDTLQFERTSDGMNWFPVIGRACAAGCGFVANGESIADSLIGGFNSVLPTPMNFTFSSAGSTALRVRAIYFGTSDVDVHWLAQPGTVVDTVSARGAVSVGAVDLSVGTGQQLMSASLPVVLASNQTPVPTSTNLTFMNSVGVSSAVNLGDTTNSPGLGAIPVGAFNLIWDSAVGTWRLQRMAVDGLDSPTPRVAGAQIIAQYSVNAGTEITSGNFGNVRMSSTRELSVIGSYINASAPTAASVGVASASCLAANDDRRAATFVNTSAATISLGFGQAAVLNSGVTLQPGAAFNMSAMSGMLSTEVVNCIASAAASNLAIQESVYGP